MCRILSIIGKIDHETKISILKDFQQLAKYGKVPLGVKDGHHDGWGVVLYENNKISYINKSEKSAFSDKKYNQVISEITNLNQDILIAHLRKASVGRRNINNSHPFVFGNHTFCQNGKIVDSECIPLGNNYKKAITGSTDSEKFFLFLLENIKILNPKSPIAFKGAIKEAVDFIGDNFDYTALNFVFCDGRHVWVMREVNLKNDVVKEKKLFPYYSLFLGINRVKKYQIICSEKMDIKGVQWRSVKNHEILKLVLSS